MNIVKTKDLVKTYNGVNAVDGLSLNVPEGCIYGFLGPNGAGKTTTIKMLTGLANPNAGEIYLFGKKVTPSEKRSGMGFLPDVPGFYNWMNAVEYLDFCSKLVMPHIKSYKKEINELLDLVGLNGVRKKIGGYSRGMKQRLGIAQAMIGDPKIIFLDEPTSALDPIGRKEVLDIVATLAGRVTVFFSTHILADVERVCDRAVIINKGKVILEGPIETLKGISSSTHVLVEVDNENSKKILIDKLSTVKWVDRIENSNNGTITINASDIKSLQKELPGIIYQNGLMLKKFNIIEPTLEDIFIKAVNDK